MTFHNLLMASHVDGAHLACKRVIQSTRLEPMETKPIDTQKRAKQRSLHAYLNTEFSGGDENQSLRGDVGLP